MGMRLGIYPLLQVSKHVFVLAYNARPMLLHRKGRYTTRHAQSYLSLSGVSSMCFAVLRLNTPMRKQLEQS
ncbi:hypothetical protein J6590_035385 [Homalodisca vitripennis]|nr:hypothetical protein J6590_035385 [Homalodisca vitripennis]